MKNAPSTIKQKPKLVKKCKQKTMLSMIEEADCEESMIYGEFEKDLQVPVTFENAYRHKRPIEQVLPQ